MSRPRRMLAAAAIGLGAAGVGMTAQRRALRRIQRRPDPHAMEPFGSLRGRPAMVWADDGTRLYAEIDGADRTDLAIVFSHGWTLSQDSWHFQRKALRGVGRLVFWDHRGHGRSDGGPRDHHNLDQLGADLAAVIDQTVPEGTPVVLVGHSMGGMTIMRYADRYPGAFHDRVVAAGLVCTSSGALGEMSLGLPPALAKITQRALPYALRAAAPAAPALERVRHLGRTGSRLIMDRIAFGPDASPAALAFAEQMTADTRLDALIDFFVAMSGTPIISMCNALDDIDTLIIAGENDVLTPVEHSATISSCVPSARLEVVPVSGHMVMMERPDALSGRLHDLIERAHKSIAA